VDDAPRHLVRWLVLGLCIAIFAAQCAYANWPKPSSPVATAPAGERVIDEPGYSSSGNLESPSAGDRDQVTALLERRARAVLSGNEPMFMSTVDTADRAFAVAQRVVFSNTQQFPLATFGYELGDPVYPDDILHTPSYVTDVTIDYRLDGYDAAESQVDDGFTFVKVDGEWRLDSVSDADQQFDSHQLAPPWEGRAVTTYGDGQYLAVVDDGATTLAHRLVSLCHRAATASRQLLGISNAGAAVIIATTTRHGFNDFVGPDTVAVTYPAQGPHGFVGWRVKVAPDYVARVLDEPITLTHELTHLATRAYFGSAPAWLAEGAAEYVAWHRHGGLPTAYRRSAVELQGKHLDSLPDSAGFYQVDAPLNYLESQALVSYIATTYGKAAILHLFEVYRSAGIHTVAVDSVTESTLKSVLHVGKNVLAHRAYDALMTATGESGP
jgi:hypothetical protein